MNSFTTPSGGAFVTKTSGRANGKVPLATLAVTGAVLVAIGLYTSGRPSIYAVSSFWTSSPTWFAIRVGVLQLGLVAIFVVEQIVSRESSRSAGRLFTAVARAQTVPMR